MNIKGRWAFITGSSRGVGLRVAKALAEQGCRIILHSRELESTRDIVKSLQDKDVTVYAVAGELSKQDDVIRIIDEVKEITGDKLDILYNNAAIMTPYSETFEPKWEEYELSFTVNVITPVKLCDAFIPGMLERDWGRVVNVTSGIHSEPQLMAYSCSKAGLDRYVRDMVNTLKGSNVLMNLLDPGWLRTDMGGETAPNDPDSVIPGALVPVLLEKESGSGQLYEAQSYRTDS